MRELVRSLACAAAVGCLPVGAFAGDANVTTYHADGRRSGLYVVPGLTFQQAATAHLDAAFVGHVPGHVYAQPLYWRPPGTATGRLIVATEDNDVLALDAQSGAVLWQVNVGVKVPLSALPCGDIDPIGVTGTPVIDAAAGVVYLDAFAYGGGAPRHLLHALSLQDGRSLPGWPIDVARLLGAAGHRFDASIQNQRSALSLVGQELLVAYGGQSGDCRAYHGWVVGVDCATAALVGAWRTRGQKGGIWGQGGLSDDGTSIFATTGNTYGATQWADGEAVFRLPPGLQHSPDPRDFFAPANWATLDRTDQDLGSTGPLPIDLPGAGGPQPVLLQMGKDGNAYVLDRINLGGIGTAPVVRHVVDGRITTGPAVYPLAGGVGVALYAVGTAADCASSGGNADLLALRLAAGSPPSLSTAWCVALNGRGAPIVTTSDGRSDPIVWVVGAQGDELLHGYRGDTGATVFDGGGPGQAIPNVRHFATAIVAEGRLYVAGDGRLYAFAFGGP